MYEQVTEIKPETGFMSGKDEANTTKGRAHSYRLHKKLRNFKFKKKKIEFLEHKFYNEFVACRPITT
jgi:hypothetical protein